MANVVQGLDGAARLASRRWTRHDDAYIAATSAAAADPGYAKAYSIDWWLISGFFLAVMGANALGSPLVALALLFALILCARNLRLVWGATLYYLPLQIFCVFALLSIFWADDPGVTQRHAIELAATFTLAIILSRRVAAREFVSALLIPGIIICAVPYATGTTWLHGEALVGPFGSKNFLAFTAQATLITSLAVLFDKQQNWFIRLLALSGAGLALVDVVLGQSAGAVVTSVVSVVAFIPLAFLDRLPRAGRFAAVAVLIVCLAPLLFAIDGVKDQVQWVQTEVLHKDTTLTKRTDLWIKAHDLIVQRPWLGRGYAGFWRPGNPDAEAIFLGLRGGASGFNFHNQFLDAQVEGGIVEVFVLVALLIGIASAALWRGLTKPTVYTAYFLVVILSLYSRLPVESGLIGAWNILTILFIAAGVHAVSPSAPELTKAGETANP